MAGVYPATGRHEYATCPLPSRTLLTTCRPTWRLSQISSIWSLRLDAVALDRTCVAKPFHNLQMKIWNAEVQRLMPATSRCRRPVELLQHVPLPQAMLMMLMMPMLILILILMPMMMMMMIMMMIMMMMMRMMMRMLDNDDDHTQKNK